MKRFAVFFLLLVACRSKPGRVLVWDGTNTEARPIASKANPERIATTADVVSYDRGSGYVYIEPQGGARRIVKHPLDKPAFTSTCTVAGSNTRIMAASNDGRVVMVQEDAKGTSTLTLVDIESCASVSTTVRLVWRSAVSPDGSEGLFGGVQSTCTTDLNHCPANLIRLKIAGSAIDVVRGGPRAHYQPLYMKDGRVLFQTTERDTSCDGTIDNCRHDLVTAPRDHLDTPNLEVVREGGIGPVLSHDEKKLAFLAYLDPGRGCTKLPCSSLDLMVGDFKGGKDVRVARQVVNMQPTGISLDDKRIAFTVGTGGSTRITRVCSLDGKNCEDFGIDTRPVGWVK